MNVSPLPEMKFIQRFIQNNRPLEIALLISEVKIFINAFLVLINNQDYFTNKCFHP